MIIANNTKEKVTKSDDLVIIMRKVYAQLPEEDKHKEIFYTIGLDSQNRIKVIDLTCLGTINRANPEIREIFRIALLKDCVAVIVVHNHPSGDSQPSKEDRNFTKSISQGGKIMHITLLDHIILGDGFYSFSDTGSL